MAILKYLVEALEAQELYNGLKGKWETFFKVDGDSYGFKAEAIVGEKIDAPMWELKCGALVNDRLDGSDYAKKVFSGFVEATKQFISEVSPAKFFIVGGGAYDKIADALKTGIKGYKIVDEREKVDDKEGNPVGNIIFTKDETKKDEIDPNPKMADNKTTFDTYELPKDIDKKVANATEKLDDGKSAYNPKAE